MSTDRKEETATPVATLSALPIELKELSLDDALYRATPPLRFHVSFDAEDRLYDLDGDFEITLSANSRPELLRELHEVLTMLWIDYAQEEPERLSPKAQDLRTELLHRLQAADYSS